MMTLPLPALTALVGCAQKQGEGELKRREISARIGVRDPDDGIRIPMNFPAPKWEVGDWWDLDYQNYVDEGMARIQPANNRQKVGWGPLHRWKYEVVGTENVRGDDCYVLEMRNRGTIETMWLRTTDLLVMRRMDDTLFYREMRTKDPTLGKHYFPKPLEETTIGPFGRPANFSFPLGLPLFGVAWNISPNKQTLTDIPKETLLKKASDSLRERIRPLIGPRSAKIVITDPGAGFPETQYWNSSLPWFVYGEYHTVDGPERSQYWLVDFGKKGEKHEPEHP
jgi:hypothetical protein